jgi:insulysin
MNARWIIVWPCNSSYVGKLVWFWLLFISITDDVPILVLQQSRRRNKCWKVLRVRVVTSFALLSPNLPSNKSISSSSSKRSKIGTFGSNGYHPPCRIQHDDRMQVLLPVCNINDDCDGCLSLDKNKNNEEEHDLKIVKDSIISKKKTKYTNDANDMFGMTRRDILSAILIGTSSSSLLTGSYVQQVNAVDGATEFIPSNNAEYSNKNTNALSKNMEEIITQTEPIIPFSTVRKQKLIKLSNGLQVLLVNDIKTSQSSVAMVIQGPGQFEDPEDLPGAAHLMEHMIMSYQVKSQMDGDNSGNDDDDNDCDIEEWLGNYGGSSNAFTAYDRTCFHFNCPHDMLPDALEKFASIFIKANVVQTCLDSQILQREISRIDGEFDLESLSTKLEALTKSFVQKKGGENHGDSHPFAKFSRGNIASLRDGPKLNEIDVSHKLIQFFEDYYVTNKAVLVVVGNLSFIQKQTLLFDPFITMEKWVGPFFEKTLTTSGMNKRYHYPGTFRNLSLYEESDTLLYHKGFDTNKRMVLQWVLNEDYDKLSGGNTIQIVFVLNQILGRRGQGSLYEKFCNEGWIERRSVVPLQVSVREFKDVEFDFLQFLLISLISILLYHHLAINVSGFQILRIELNLTKEGFTNRMKVKEAIYETFDTMLNLPDNISKEFLARCATTAELYGYLLTPRPPDAVELAFDCIDYGVERVESMKWYRFPNVCDKNNDHDAKMVHFQKRFTNAVNQLKDSHNEIDIMITSGDDSAMARSSVKTIDPIYINNRLNIVTIDDDWLSAYVNPFIPSSLGAPRTIIRQHDDSKHPVEADDIKVNYNYSRSSNWVVLQSDDDNTAPNLVLPRSPPESNNVRAVFVFQLLSSRPKEATAQQAAYGDLWRLSIEKAVENWAELGASGGLAYELRFNQYGMRIAFIGLRQSLSQYVIKIISSLLIMDKNDKQQQRQYSIINNGISSFALREAEKNPSLNQERKRSVMNALINTREYEVVALEGQRFFDSCTGAVCYSQGDITYSETEQLLNEIHALMTNTLTTSIDDNDGDTMVLTESTRSATTKFLPQIKDLVDTPTWCPRNWSPCYIAGTSLVSDACGRILR